MSYAPHFLSMKTQSPAGGPIPDYGVSGADLGRLLLETYEQEVEMQHPGDRAIDRDGPSRTTSATAQRSAGTRLKRRDVGANINSPKRSPPESGSLDENSKLLSHRRHHRTVRTLHTLAVCFLVALAILLVWFARRHLFDTELSKSTRESLSYQFEDVDVKNDSTGNEEMNPASTQSVVSAETLDSVPITTSPSSTSTAQQSEFSTVDEEVVPKESDGTARGDAKNTVEQQVVYLPVIETRVWNFKESFLKRVRRIEANLQPRAYRGFALSRITGEIVGSREYEDEYYEPPRSTTTFPRAGGAQQNQQGESTPKSTGRILLDSILGSAGPRSFFRSILDRILPSLLSTAPPSSTNTKITKTNKKFINEVNKKKVGIRWPQGYAEHYIGAHNVMPTRRFYEYVMWKTELLDGKPDVQTSTRTAEDEATVSWPSEEAVRERPPSFMAPVPAALVDPGGFISREIDGEEDRRDSTQEDRIVASSTRIYHSPEGYWTARSANFLEGRKNANVAVR